MEIVILRHGKVNYPPITMISASEFTDWVASYNTNELDNSSEPTEETKTIAGEAKTISL
jgi:hypothetical protein